MPAGLRGLSLGRRAGAQAKERLAVFHEQDITVVHEEREGLEELVGSLDMLRTHGSEGVVYKCYSTSSSPRAGSGAKLAGDGNGGGHRAHCPVLTPEMQRRFMRLGIHKFNHHPRNGLAFLISQVLLSWNIRFWYLLAMFMGIAVAISLFSIV